MILWNMKWVLKRSVTLAQIILSFLNFFFNVSECFAACMYMDHVCVCLESEGGIRIPGIGGTDSYESPRAWWDKPRFSLEEQQELLSLSHASRPSQVIL